MLLKKIAYSFNRYIVECKYKSEVTYPACYVVLIDTQWNVNVFETHIRKTPKMVLIDTQWNVNKKDPAIVEPLTAF